MIGCIICGGFVEIGLIALLVSVFKKICCACRGKKAKSDCHCSCHEPIPTEEEIREKLFRPRKK